MQKSFALTILLLTTFSALFSQNTAADAIRRHVGRSLGEKMHTSDPAARLAWYKAHPGQPYPQQAPDHDAGQASERSNEVVVSDDAGPESEVHAAINPADSNNIIVSAILQDASNPLAALDVPVYYSTNFGQSWSSSSVDFNPEAFSFVAGGGDPVIAFDKSGKAYISWLALTLGLSDPPLKLTLYSASSTNKGQSWSAPVTIDFGTAGFDVLGGTGSGSLVDKQWMAVDRSSSSHEGKLYVSYTRFDIIDSVTATAQILVKSKPKNSNNFGQAVQVHQNTYGIVQFSSIDIDDQGEVHVMFFAGNAPDDLALYHSVSTDGGATFSAETLVSSVHYPGLIDSTQVNPIDGIDNGRLYPCPHLRSGKTPETLYATWSADGLSGQLSPGYDVWFTKSTDNGDSWSAPVRINAGSNPAAEQFYPALAVNAQGTICLSYYDRSDDPDGTETHYVVAYSNDGGATFTPPVYASNTPSDFAQIGLANGGFGIGEYTQVVCTDYYAIPVWADGRTNDGNIDLYAAILPISGDPSSTGEIGSITDAFSVQIPNPATGALQLKVLLNESSPLSMQVFNSDGRQVWSEALRQSVPAGTVQRNIPLSPGIYLCRVETAYGFKIRRVVVE